jgi:YihY family inner membrane protein
MGERLDALLSFLKTGIWVVREKELPRYKAAGIRSLKVLLLAFRGFQRNQCAVRASALTFYSLLSVVPIVAVFFGIAKGFGFDKRLQVQLLEKFPAQTDVLQKVFEFSNAMLLKTRGGLVAGIGVALLFWSIIKVLSYIEDSFNDIWHVEHPRTIGRKLTDYLSITLVCPLIFVMASSVTVTMAGQLKAIAAKVAGMGLPPAPILVLLGIIPFLLIWVLFTFVFVFMPNTKVRLRSGFLAGVTAGTAYQLVQWVYVTFQVGVTRANAIYGSFAAELAGRPAGVGDLLCGPERRYPGIPGGIREDQRVPAPDPGAADRSRRSAKVRGRQEAGYSLPHRGRPGHALVPRTAHPVGSGGGAAALGNAHRGRRRARLPARPGYPQDPGPDRRRGAGRRRVRGTAVPAHRRLPKRFRDHGRLRAGAREVVRQPAVDRALRYPGRNRPGPCEAPFRLTAARRRG